MKTSFVWLPALCLFAACANQGQSYASKHPELPPAQRRFLETGNVPGGDAIAGMTRTQVKLAMGRDPDTFDKINGEDAWIYVRKTSVGKNTPDDFDHGDPSPMGSTRSFTETPSFGGSTDVQTTTTIFFQGDRATHAVNGEASGGARN